MAPHVALPLDIGALPDSEWGFTGIFDKQNGGGFLTEHFPEAKKAIWEFQGIYAMSRHIQGVRFAGLTHPGLIGCAPSAELLATWNTREAALIATAPTRVPPLAAPPNPQSALLGQLRGAQFDRIVTEAARTVSPREYGGNCDIKNLSCGSRIFFSVYLVHTLTEELMKFPHKAATKTKHFVDGIFIGPRLY